MEKHFVLLLGIITALCFLSAAVNKAEAASSGPMSFCPTGWNETDYRCYQLLPLNAEVSWSDADKLCGQLGVGARIAYPADNYELSMIGAVAAGNDVWLGYASDLTTFKTFFNAIGFANQFGDPLQDMCGYYHNIGTMDEPSYVLRSQLCASASAYVVCQTSYCATTSITSGFWIEYKLRCYLFQPTATTFMSAVDGCAAKGATLAVPDTQEENDFIMRIFSPSQLVNPTRWIGVKTDFDTNGNINWKNTATNVIPPIATFWPNNKAPSMPTTNGTCVYMNGTLAGNGWGTSSCSALKPSVCRQVVGALSFGNCTNAVYGKYTSWTADCNLSPGSQTRRWRKCIIGCNPSGCLQVTAKYCQYQPKWSLWGSWGSCVKPTKGSFQMIQTPCLFNGQRTRNRTCLCGTDTCGGCNSASDSTGATQTSNCNIYNSRLCPSQTCTYCSAQFANTHCYEDGSADSLTNNFRCVCDLGHYKYPGDTLGSPMGCTYADTSFDPIPGDNTRQAAECSCQLSYNECQSDYSSCTSEQLCQYPSGGPHTCYCLPGYRMIPSGGCVAASRIPPQCKIVSGSSFLKDARGNPLIPYSRGYICTCGQTDTLIKAGYSTRNSTTGEEAAARITSRNGLYMCYCFRATVAPFLNTDPVTNLPVETKYNLTRYFMTSFPECEMGYFDSNITYPQIPANLFADVDAKLADLEKRTYFKCTGAEGFNSRFEYLAQPVLGEALSPPLEEPSNELDALSRLLAVDAAAIDLFQSMLSPDCETQRSYLNYIDVMSGTEVFLGNISDQDAAATLVQMQCGNWSFPPQAVDRSQYPGVYQPLIAHCYQNATKFKSNIYNSTAAAKNQTTLSQFIKNSLKSMSFTLSFTDDYQLPAALINSGIMSVSTNPIILKMPANVYLTLTFPIYQPPAGFYQPHCTYYDFNYIDGPTWRTKESGCNTTYYNSSVVGYGNGYVQCQCNHMTIFAITMVQVIPSSYYLAAFILNAIVIGGSALSILCLALTLLIYIQLRRFSTERIGIMILCLTVGITQALLLAGAKLTTSVGTCRAISILLHFFGLLTFSMIGALSLAMYFRFVSKFRKGWQNLMTYYGLAFGIPVVTVVVTAGAFFYDYGTGYSCWMDLDGFIKWAFFVPFIVIGILSFYLLIKTAPVLYKVKGTQVKSFSQAEVYGVEFKYGVQKREKIEVIFEVSKKKFWGLIVLLCILFLTWIMGVLSMQYDSVYYDYGFAIFNASQGFFIFVMFCLREEEVRVLCCAGCMSKQQPAGKISWTKFVEIYERYFALVLHNQEEEKQEKMTFNEFVSQEYKSGAIMPEDIEAMGSHEYVSAQRGLARPNYLLTCSCCFPVRTAPMPMTAVGGERPAPAQIDLTQKLFVVGPDGQLMCLDKDGDNAAAIMEEIGRERPGSVSGMIGSAAPGRPSATGPGRGRQARAGTNKPAPVPVPVPVAENWVAPPTLFPEFPDSDEEGDVATDFAAEVKINRDLMPKPEPPPPQRIPSAQQMPAPVYDEPENEEEDEAPAYPASQADPDDVDDVSRPESVKRPSSRKTSATPGSAVPRNTSAKPGSAVPRNTSAKPGSAVPRNTSARPGTTLARPETSSARPQSRIEEGNEEEEDEDEAPKHPSSAAGRAPPSARAASSSVREKDEDDEDNANERPVSSKEEKPASSRPKSKKKATSELDPMDLED